MTGATNDAEETASSTRGMKTRKKRLVEVGTTGTAKGSTSSNWLTPAAGPTAAIAAEEQGHLVLTGERGAIEEVLIYSGTSFWTGSGGTGTKQRVAARSCSSCSPSRAHT